MKAEFIDVNEQTGLMIARQCSLPGWTLDRKIETTDSTELTDSERFMKSGSVALWMNVKNPVTYSFSVVPFSVFGS